MSEIVEQILAGIVTITLIILLGILMVAVVPEPIVTQGNPVYSNEAFKKAHRYHGINHSYRVDDMWFFDRDGRRCKLFAYMGGR